MRTLSVGLLAATAVAISMVLSRSRWKLSPAGAGPASRFSTAGRSLDQIRAAGL